MNRAEYVERMAAEYRACLQRQLSSGIDLWAARARMAKVAVDAVVAFQTKLRLSDAPGREGIYPLFENRCALCRESFDDYAEVDICGFCRDAILKGEVRDDIWGIAHPVGKVSQTA